VAPREERDDRLMPDAELREFRGEARVVVDLQALLERRDGKGFPVQEQIGLAQVK
jgi:hypothetical protein